MEEGRGKWAKIIFVMAVTSSRDQSELQGWVQLWNKHQIDVLIQTG